MRIKMIVTDLDGTFLYEDESLPRESIGIINRCREKGVLFVVATSRSMESAKRITDMLNPDAIISSGGANAICGDNIVYDAMLSAEDSDKLIKKCINDKEVEFIRVVGEEIDLTNNSRIGFGEMEFGHYIKTDFQVIPKQRISKITICSPNIEHINEMFKNEKQCCVIASYSEKNYHKLAHSKATKEDALLEVTKHFGLSFKDILSFGDDISDMNMLYYSEIGVAVHNAKKCVKDVADYICDSNDKQGVINYLSDNFESLFGGV